MAWYVYLSIPADISYSTRPPDIAKGRVFLGFGYDHDPASDDYKIVRGDGVEVCEVAVFSLKSGSWRRILIQRDSHLFVFYRGLYWNGALHWCVDDKRSNKTKSVIVSFDLSEEKFRRMLPVPEIDGDILFDGLGIHGANLFIHTWDADCFMAWITKEYGRGGSWTKLFSLSTKGIPGEYWKIPIEYTRSRQIVFEIDVHDMILFNP
ncbi:hypothetical protein NL676_037058 [Syzygium grande]|nr:hypothetical protein NL676_037058 [Syzygium grande]